MTVGKLNLIAFSSSTLRADEGYLTHLWHCMGLNHGGYEGVRSGCAYGLPNQNFGIAGLVEGADRNRQGLPL